MWRKGKKLAQVARLWAIGQLYEPDQDGPDEVIDDAAAALGLYIVPSDESEPPEDTCYLWPCNVPIWNLWNQLQTQWICNPNGREGLNYAAIIPYMQEVTRIRPKKFSEYFYCIQAMERASLKAWADK